MKFSTILNTFLITSFVSAVDVPEGATDRRPAPYQFVGNNDGTTLQWDLLIKDKQDATSYQISTNSPIEGFEVTGVSTSPQLEALTSPDRLQDKFLLFKAPNNASFDGDGSNQAQFFTFYAHATGNETEYTLSLHVVTDKEQFNVSETLN